MSDQARCPLCSGPNHCALADGGTAVESCWCATTVIPERVLERLPDEQRGVSCICQRCAQEGDGWPSLTSIVAERLKQARRDR